MNEFSITTGLTKNEYIKISYTGLYRKPYFIFSTLLGIYFVVTVILDYLSVIDWYDKTPTFEIACGAFLLAAPSLMVWMAVQQFRSNPCFENDTTYTFSDTGFVCQGQTFKSELLWTHIIKHKEIGKYLILYQSSKSGYFIDKTKLKTEQLEFIKSKVRQR